MNIEDKNLTIHDLLILDEYIEIYNKFCEQLAIIRSSSMIDFEFEAWNNYCKTNFGFDFKSDPANWSPEQNAFDKCHNYSTDIAMFVWERICRRMTVKEMIALSDTLFSYNVFTSDEIEAEYMAWLEDNGYKNC